jgi:hypothetical protein
MGGSAQRVLRLAVAGALEPEEGVPDPLLVGVLLLVGVPDSLGTAVSTGTSEGLVVTTGDGGVVSVGVGVGVGVTVGVGVALVVGVSDGATTASAGPRGWLVVGRLVARGATA